MERSAQIQVDSVCDLVLHVLAGAVLGVYLHGSGARTGLRHSSDVDVLVVASRGLRSEERVALVTGLMPLSGSRARPVPARPVELTVVVACDIRPETYPPVVEFQYGEWLREDYEAGVVPSRESASDLVVVITSALGYSSVLMGPSLASLLPSFPAAAVRRAVLEAVPSLLDDLESDTRNVLLTLARVWLTLATGEIRSKDAAAAWCLPRIAEDHRAVLAWARDDYLRSAITAGVGPAATRSPRCGAWRGTSPPSVSSPMACARRRRAVPRHRRCRGRR